MLPPKIKEASTLGDTKGSRSRLWKHLEQMVHATSFPGQRAMQTLPKTAHRRLYRTPRMLQCCQRNRCPEATTGPQRSCELTCCFHMHEPIDPHRRGPGSNSAAYICNIQSAQLPEARRTSIARRRSTSCHVAVAHIGNTRTCKKQSGFIICLDKR